MEKLLAEKKSAKLKFTRKITYLENAIEEKNSKEVIDSAWSEVKDSYRVIEGICDNIYETLSKDEKGSKEYEKYEKWLEEVSSTYRGLHNKVSLYKVPSSLPVNT